MNSITLRQMVPCVSDISFVFVLEWVTSRVLQAAELHGGSDDHSPEPCARQDDESKSKRTRENVPREE